MRCPSCDQPNYSPSEPCPRCQFSGDPGLIEELAHVDWVLREIDSWPPLVVPEKVRQRVQEKYRSRQRDLEIALVLRLPPFTKEQARQAWPELFQGQALHERMNGWLGAGLLDSAASQAFLDRIRERVNDLSERLEGHARPDYGRTDADRLGIVGFLLQSVDELSQGGCFVSTQAEAEARQPLVERKGQLETKLGLRPSPKPEEAGEPAPQAVAPASEAEAAAPIGPTVPPAPPSPPVPFRERLWRTLVSERTLRAILFLGIFLLFAAAISFVVWGWRDFSPLLRIAIPTGFTALFFALGWYVRVKMSLYRSGIALSAIASLLIPIDFYTAFVNLEIPPDLWPEFWLATSLFCLAAYVVVTLTIQNILFGYLVGTAAGSVVLAAIEIGHKSLGLSRDWYTAGLSVLAVAMLPLGTALARAAKPGRWRVLANPLRYLALLTAGVLMPLTFGWRFIDRDTYDTLHYALIVNWWLGGLIFGWGAVYHRSRGLGLLAAIALPVATYLAQAAVFDHTGTNPAWHAFGWACLVPLYFAVGHRLLARTDDPVIHSHGRTATDWGIVLTVAAALWSFTDLTSGAAAASSHAVLVGAVVLAAVLWHRPRSLYVASLLSLSAATFGMAEAGLSLVQLGVGWASLSIAHIVIALNLGSRASRSAQGYAPPLVVAGYILAAVALLPPLLVYDGSLLAYALGNWIGLTAWGAYLAHAEQVGFAPQPGGARPLGRIPIFHWFASLPLPFWLWIASGNRRPPDASLALAFSALAGGTIALSHWLARRDNAYHLPWHVTGICVNLAAPVIAFFVAPDGFAPALCLLSTGLLFFVDAIVGRHSIYLAPGGVATAWGLGLLLDRLLVPSEVQDFALASLAALYLVAGLWTERKRSRIFTQKFLLPLYLTAHALTLYVLARIYLHPFESLATETPWTDAMRLWGAAAQLVLGIVYGLYTWGTYEEGWGHVAAWLGAASGGFLLTIYSRGRGSSAAKAALIAIAFVLAERCLHWLWQRRELRRRWRAFLRLAWHLYRRPLLATGWIVSVGVIGLALVRNLVLLGGGRTQQTWAALGLLLITGLYALSARLFRRPGFVWPAATLMFVPWTILTNLGWFTALRPTPPGFAIGWAALAWVLYLVSLMVKRIAPRPYELPLRTTAHLLLPYSLLWGIADVDTSRVTFGLAVCLYGLNAWLDALQVRRVSECASIYAATKFRYPAFGLVPAWCVYLVAWLLPGARHEHYGLMFLAFGALGLLSGRLLSVWAPPQPLPPRAGLRGNLWGLPAYLTGYISLIVGTMLVAHVAPLLALALLYGAALMLVSARLFRNPLWVYPAAAMVPISLLISLHEAGVAADRYGWWLIGLAAIYLLVSWCLRRAKLDAYGTGVLAAGFALIALSLPPSSQDQTGALWGYGGAALLYAIAAVWLRQALLLTPACALAIVPYAIGLQRSALVPDYYGLALFPGALLALGLGWVLDARLGNWRDFPWLIPLRWPVALADRLLGWWGLPLYVLGFGLAVASPFFTDARADLSALNWALLMLLCGWGIYRFRIRGWLLAMGLAGHLAVFHYLSALGWWAYPPQGWLRFLPVTITTTVVGLLVERFRKEGSPLNPRHTLRGWSRPLYLLAAADIVVAQVGSLGQTGSSAAVTLVHALLVAVLASAWRSPELPYLTTALGVAALWQWLAALSWPRQSLPVTFSQLALGYGAVGYGLGLLRDRYLSRPTPPPRTPRAPTVYVEGIQDLSASTIQKPRPEPGLPPWPAVWERSLQRSALILSWLILALAGWLGIDLVGWTVRAMLGSPFRQIVEMDTARMAIGVLSLLGLLYVAASVTHRRPRLGYAAVGMLLAGWMLYAFYIRQWDDLAQVQWYAMPAGLYLMMVSYLEWRRGNKGLARWLDYAAMLLMIGSLFWQTLRFGWRYALLLGAEGFSALWWGSARRMRRFFYAGMVGVILATLGQLINSLQSINQWIVFGIIGLLLVIVAAVVERRLETIRASLREVLEHWE
jgi:hypothetical protein